MRQLAMFDSVSLDGFFTSPDGDMSWLHASAPNAEWDAFVAGNASGNGALVFGRITYQMMAGWWPTPAAAKMAPQVASGMNAMPKYVFSRTLNEATWNNTTLLGGDLATEMRALKASAGPDLVILGSGSLVGQLTELDLIDEFQVVVYPIIIGTGRSLFQGVTTKRRLKRTEERAFGNGNVFLRYERSS